MAKVRVRKETGKVYFDFHFRGVRCREYTALEDSPANRRRAQQMLERIEAEITLGTFEYVRYFPQSPYVARFAAAESTPVVSAGVAGAAQAGSACTPTFADFADEWWKLNELRWRKSTQEANRGVLDKYLLPAFKDRQVGDIRRKDVLEFRSELAKAPGRSGNVTLSNKSINHHMGILRMILVEASEQHGFNNPFAKIEALVIKKPHIDPFTLDEVTLMLNTIRGDYRDYLAVRCFTAMRSGEIDGLKWKYIDFKRRQILVRETFSKGRVEYTKTDGSQREIEMSTPVYEALRRQAKVTGESGLDGFVFRSAGGGPIDVQNFTQRVWYPLLRYLGFRERRPYQTRHTCATLWLGAGENPEWIARQLGHTTTEMLFRVYSRYVPNLTRRDGSAFEKLVSRMSCAEPADAKSAASLKPIKQEGDHAG